MIVTTGTRYHREVDADGTVRMRKEVITEERDPDEVRAEAKAALREAAWAFVDEHLDPREREALNAMLHQATIMQGMGLPVDQGALLALLATLGWAQDALTAWEPLADKVDQARTFEEIQAVAWDPSDLLPPPRIVAAEIARALKRGQ